TMPRSHDAAFEQRKCRLNGICVDIPFDVHAVFVANRLVLLCVNARPLHYPRVRGEFIRHNHVNVCADILADILCQRARLRISSVEETQFAATLTDTEHYFFVVAASLYALSFALPANVGFIHFDGARHVRSADLLDSMADAMTQIPCGAVIDSEHPF